MTRLSPRFEDGRAMLLAGLRRRIPFIDCPAVIPDMWRDFMEKTPLPAQRGGAAYGAVAASDGAAGVLEYMCAVEVDDFSKLDDRGDQWGRMRVPAANYAVFAVDGGVAGIAPLWGAIHQQWMPRSGYAHAPSPGFERYSERFRETNGAAPGDIEIWLPVYRS